MPVPWMEQGVQAACLAACAAGSRAGGAAPAGSQPLSPPTAPSWRSGRGRGRPTRSTVSPRAWPQTPALPRCVGAPQIPRGLLVMLLTWMEAGAPPLPARHGSQWGAPHPGKPGPGDAKARAVQEMMERIKNGVVLRPAKERVALSQVGDVGLGLGVFLGSRLCWVHQKGGQDPAPRAPGL